jgi:hypothetical protein
MCGTTEAAEEGQPKELAPIRCDYLVVGAGTAGMSFVDTLLTHDPAATVVLVDRNSAAGGHWTKAYPFVRLHQPACNYGVNSLALGKRRDSKGREKFDIEDRATGPEIAEYYSRVADQFRESGRVQFFFDSEYREVGNGQHRITKLTTGEVVAADCGKIVKVHTNLLVPSMRDGPPFPVSPSVNVAVVNDLPKHIQSAQYSKYVVVGAGKTGCDSITHLLRNGVDQSAITWVISRDVWYFLRDGYIRPNHTYWQDVSRLLKPLDRAPTFKDAFLAYEKDGVIGRLDPENRPYPEVFKGATIDNAELAGLRTVKNIVRMGRVTSITDESLFLEEGALPISSSDTLIVDCMADFDHTTYGYEFSNDFKVFEAGRINLGPMCTVFNPSFSSAIIAYIETTFEENDDMKNSLLYFPRGKHAAPTHNSFFAMFFAESKTMEALGKHPPAMKFVLASRTNSDAPLHHGGFLRFLWGMFGPLKIAKKGSSFVKKVENGGFADVQDSFGNGRPVPDANALRVKETKGRKKIGRNLKHTAYVSYPSKKSTAKSSFNCCTTVDAVQ